MNKVEAIKAMLEGKKVTRDNWEKYRYVYLDKSGYFMFVSDDGETEEDLNEYNFTGWKIYTEPKKKVDLYLWAYKEDGEWHITDEFYPKDQIFTDDSEEIFRLDWAKITIEED